MIVYNMRDEQREVNCETGETLRFTCPYGDGVVVVPERQFRNGNVRLFMQSFNGRTDIHNIGYGDLYTDGQAHFSTGGMFDEELSPDRVGFLYRENGELVQWQ